MRKIVFINLLGLIVLNTISQELPELPFYESVDVFTDRNEYIAGEIMWFSVYGLKSKGVTFSKIAYVEIVNKHGISVVRKKVKLINGRGSGSLLLSDSLATGGYNLIAYTNWMKNNPERICQTNILVYNPLKPIKTEKSERRKNIWDRKIDTQTRYNDILIAGLENVEFEKNSPIQFYLKNKGAKMINVTVTVRKVSNLEYEKAVNDKQICIKDDTIENIGLLFNNENKNIYNYKFLPEIKGALVSGRILNNQGEPLVNHDVFLSFPDSVIRLKIEKTNELGEFFFFIEPEYPSSDIVINANNHSKNLTFLLNNNYLNDYSFINEYVIDSIGSDKKQFLDELYINYRVKKLYEISNAQEGTSFDHKKKFNFYTQADRVIQINDYMQLDSIHEYFYEVIQEVKVLDLKTNPRFKVINGRTAQPFEGFPALFIDGVYIEDARLMLDVNPKECNRIEIIQKPILLKNRYYEGLVALFTNNYNLHNISLPTNTLRIQNTFFNKSENFKLIKKTDSGDSVPVFQNTLYWNPEVAIEPNEDYTISFQTGDDNTWYEIEVSGYTNFYERVHLNKLFKVGIPFSELDE